MDHGQFKVTLKKVDKKFAYTICELELTNVEVRTYVRTYVCASRPTFVTLTEEIRIN